MRDTSTPDQLINLTEKYKRTLEYVEMTVDIKKTSVTIEHQQYVVLRDMIDEWQEMVILLIAASSPSPQSTTQSSPRSTETPVTDEENVKRTIDAINRNLNASIYSNNSSQYRPPMNPYSVNRDDDTSVIYS